MLSNVIFDKVWHFELRNSLILKRQLFIVFIGKSPLDKRRFYQKVT